MDPGGEQRVHETGRVPDQNPAVSDHCGRRVRPVLHDVRTGNHSRALEHRVRVEGALDLAAVVCLDAAAPDAVLTSPRVHDDANARPSTGQWDVPHPSLVVGLDENVGLVRGRQALAILEVGVHSHVAEVPIPLSKSERSAEDSGLPAGVNNPAGLNRGLRTVLGSDFYAPDSTRIQERAGYRHALAHDNPRGAGVIEQNLVERRTPHLIGVRIGLVGLPEVPRPRFGVLSPDHCRPPLLGKTGFVHPAKDAEVFEHRHRSRKQRLPNVVTRETRVFEENDFKPCAGEQRRGCAASRPSANDGDVVVHAGCGNYDTRS